MSWFSDVVDAVESVASDIKSLFTGDDKGTAWTLFILSVVVVFAAASVALKGIAPPFSSLVVIPICAGVIIIGLIVLGKKKKHKNRNPKKKQKKK